jgi:hypothetical protein
VLMLAGYLLMTLTPNIYLLLVATVVRSLGSASLWIYSTLLLQIRVENELQGEWRSWHTLSAN